MYCKMAFFPNYQIMCTALSLTFIITVSTFYSIHSRVILEFVGVCVNFINALFIFDRVMYEISVIYPKAIILKFIYGIVIY